MTPTHLQRLEAAVVPRVATPETYGLSKDLGFTAADRIENIRRVGEVAAMVAHLRGNDL